MKKPKQRCVCGAKFVPIRRNQKHCSPTCRSRVAQRKWRDKVQKALQAQEAL